jgi:hypothetical protein
MRADQRSVNMPPNLKEQLISERYAFSVTHASNVERPDEYQK